MFSDDTIIEKDFSTNESVAISQWFPKSSEIKGVFSNGHLFSVKYWSCEHYGKQAVMIIGPQMETIPEELNNHVAQLGEIALSKDEFKRLIDSLADKPLKLSDTPTRLNITSNEFDEFYLQINVVGETILIEIKLYKS